MGDMGPCRESGYNILAPVANPTDDVKYCPAYNLGKPDDPSFEKTLVAARAVGDKDGCSTCTGSELKTGYKALFVGTVKTADEWSGEAPIKLTVSEILAAGSACPNGKEQTTAPCDSYVLPKLPQTEDDGAMGLSAT